MSEALRITIEDLTHAAAELRRLHALNAELVEALRQVEGMIKLSPHALSITRAALAKARVEARNGS